MEVLDRLDTRLTSVLTSKGWKRQGTRRFIGRTHIVEVLPGGAGDRVTVFYGRLGTSGDPSRLAECSRITLVGHGELDRFVTRL
ncbi:hypothetical protein [Mobilicoccus caccae]|uniref:CobW C-terminal domain-containing protein n=1 Tax=Mobilicoccus caccae TaxID=1859295 RepID=A0ABQ6ISC0_9MICO|nr:hypothetical protein [Mobilicoccus caccae]GMA39622.1 hypothetical protein GCM10025883_16670 [Mobilicoccus caccae]